MIEASKESLCINKLISEKKEIVIVEGDMIVPDSKPDILNTICTSGVVSIYKKESLNEKVRLDGNLNTYIMYIPDGEEDIVRGLNTTLDFSEVIDIPNCTEEMSMNNTVKVSSIECKVLNGRKINIKATLEIMIQIYSSENIDIINDINNTEEMQMLKQDLIVNSLVGQGSIKIDAKDTIRIDNTDNLAEILKVNVEMVDKDIKISYNKVLSKAEAEIKLIYLTEDNRINTVTARIPVVGFIDIQNVMEENICDTQYEIKNIIIKPNSQEEHSIYTELEVEVNCNVYEEKAINLIQDMYIPCRTLNFNKKQISTMTEKKNFQNMKQIRERINLKDIENKNLLDVDVKPNILKETKINSKILYEGELELKFTFTNSNMQVTIKEIKIPFEYTIENLQNGEEINTCNDIEVKNQDFIINEDGNIDCNIDMLINTSGYRNANINIIDSIEESEEREEQDYSIVIYIVKKGDTLWEIAKKLGSTVESIAIVNGIENRNEIYPGQKLFIPRYNKVPIYNYE